MIEFEKPNIECLEVDDENNYAKFVCEPLERGYGITIGNSLRRILLIFITRSSYNKCKNRWSCYMNFLQYQML